MASIVVVGSINMDVVSRVHALPLPGQTVHALATAYHPGGKGANQAAAAARAGADVTMLGAVGDDAFAATLQAALRDSGVRVDHLLVRSTTSGLAFITVDDEGQNTITLSQGANGQMPPADVAAARDLLTSARALLLQNEIPRETTRLAMTIAHDAGVRVLFNPAPALDLPRDAYPLVDTLILNEVEASALVGMPVAATAEAEIAARQLIADGARAVIITLGQHGAIYLDSRNPLIVLPAFSVTPLDTTGAGDIFIGAYAAAALTQSVHDALRFAAAAAALSVTRHGAQRSAPTRDEIAAFLRAHAR
jgi:ribokinase